MSVASELELLAGAKEDIAAAISEKGGTAPAGLVGYADVIRKLPCSLDSLPINDEEASWCIFLNCDGEVVAWYNKAQTLQLTALPPVPDPPFSGLVNGMWNWTLAEIKASTLPMCIGPLYDTNDGKSWFDIEIPEDGYEWNILVESNQVSTYGRIDFGDGSAEENATQGLHSHIYASKGEYRVKVYATNGDQSKVYVGGNMRSLCGAGQSTSYPKNVKNMACLKRAAVMFNYQAPHMFADAYNLEYYIARTSSSTATGQGFGPNMFKLRQISIRRNGNGFTGGGSLNSLTNARSLKASCYSPTVPSSENGSAHYSSSEMVIRLPYTGRTGNISQSAYNGNRNIRLLRVPGAQTLGSNSIFNGDNLLERIIFPSPVSPTVVNTSVFQDCLSLSKIDNLSLASVATLGSNAFQNCRKLWFGETVSFPALTSISQNSLNNTGSREFVIGSSGTTLSTSSTGAFAYNYMLEKVTFMGDVDYVRASFFNCCYMLRTVSFANATSVPVLDNVNAFANTPSLQRIIVPDSLYSTWIATTNWSSTTNNIVNCIVRASDVMGNIQTLATTAGMQNVSGNTTVGDLQQFLGLSNNNTVQDAIDAVL